MFNKVLVTLDGSLLAESLLPWVADFVAAANSKEVVFLSVIETDTAEQLHIAEGYLRNKADDLEQTWKGRESAMPSITCIAVRYPELDVASAILSYAEDNGIDLIMLATHGRSGINRWLLGSVAEKVLRGVDMPVFLVRAYPEPAKAPIGLKRLLVPLDGSKLAEQALPYAEHLAESEGAEVTLLYVEPVQEAATFSRAPAAGLRTSRRKDMESYLDSMRSGLVSTGIKAETRMRLGHPAEQITDEVIEGSIDMIVMSSHGRTGLARWALGSVADQVLRASPMPVLLFPSRVSGTVPPHLQGPLVRRCHHCGRQTFRETFTHQERCPRCQYLLKACGNCVHFDGIGCILQLPYVADVHPGNRCPQFEFRKTRLVLR
jgi:nucleotide-binding universal stress UspA family protein